ncbi:DNA polymerase [uncultured Ferrimonas sp.]|uniref:DNA polymerase n=1 Tax=uncultured Ferrimonas sp. TaxID=432640 RepID=UPI0026262312|nr:DNA polymerase [uncultured Ferrimonas sp.]
MKIEIEHELARQLVEAKYRLNGLPEHGMTWEQKQINHLMAVAPENWVGIALKRLKPAYAGNPNAELRAEVVTLYHKISKRGIAIDRKELARLIEEYTEKLRQDPFSEKLYKTLDWLKRVKVGADGKLRTELKPYHSITGRTGLMGTTPVNGFKVFRQALISAPKDNTTLSVDYTACEAGILAALSGDPKLKDDYANSDDLYETIANHLRNQGEEQLERKQAKTLFLTSIYGAKPNTIALKLKLSETDTERLQKQVMDYYTVAFTWLQERTIESYRSKLITSDSWQIHVSPDVRPTQIRNWPIQMMGMEIINSACLQADQKMLKVVGVVHDCIYIECRNENVEEETAALQKAMTQASRQQLDGFVLKTSVDFTTHC